MILRKQGRASSAVAEQNGALSLCCSVILESQPSLTCLWWVSVLGGQAGPMTSPQSRAVRKLDLSHNTLSLFI